MKTIYKSYYIMFKIITFPINHQCKLFVLGGDKKKKKFFILDPFLNVCKLEIINKQAVVHKQWHMSSQNDDWMLRLKSIQTGILFYWVHKKLEWYNVILYLRPLWFSRQERSVTPSLFNIEARGMAHCLPRMKLR